ncbi:MAG: lactate racemase domain-containing protein, partial [Vicinamibacterales bacterium]
MQATLPFGDSTLDAELPARTRAISRGGSAGSGGGLAAVADLEAAVRDALDHPLGLPPIRDLVKPGARVVIAFDDPTVTSFGP